MIFHVPNTFDRYTRAVLKTCTIFFVKTCKYGTSATQKVGGFASGASKNISGLSNLRNLAPLMSLIVSSNTHHVKWKNADIVQLLKRVTFVYYYYLFLHTARFSYTN